MKYVVMSEDGTLYSSHDNEVNALNRAKDMVSTSGGRWNVGKVIQTHTFARGSCPSCSGPRVEEVKDEAIRGD